MIVRVKNVVYKKHRLQCSSNLIDDIDDCNCSIKFLRQSIAFHISSTNFLCQSFVNRDVHILENRIHIDCLFHSLKNDLEDSCVDVDQSNKRE